MTANILVDAVSTFTTNPFDTTFPTYLAGGWEPIPLPPKAKKHPPAGTTGRSGTPLTVRQLHGYVAHRCNIGLRMPAGVIGIDVDQYDRKDGAARLDDYRAKHHLSVLPATPRSSSRGPGSPAGISYYRVPAWFTTGGQLCDYVDVIQHHHRYAVAPPSTHPRTGRIYTWFAPDGRPAHLTDAGLPLPGVDQLAALPPDWVDRLTTTLVAAAPHRPLPVTASVPDRAARALEAAIDRLEHAVEGNRNNLLNWVAHVPGREALAAGISADLVGTALLDAAEKIGLPRAEAAATIRSGLGEGRGAVA